MFALDTHLATLLRLLGDGFELAKLRIDVVEVVYGGDYHFCEVIAKLEVMGVVPDEFGEGVLKELLVGGGWFGCAGDGVEDLNTAELAID